MRALAALLLAPLLLAQPAGAQDDGVDGYTIDDEIAMQSCIEAVRDVNADPEAVDLAQESDCIGAASGLCQDEPDGQTTMGMIACLARETAWWDEQLNVRYQGLRDSLDETLFAGLRGVQTAWIAYRDARCGFEYDYWADGTIRGIVYGSCMLELTASRAIELGAILEWEHGG